MDRIPDIIRSTPAPQGYACTMRWASVEVTGYGKTRQEASGAAALLYGAVMWLLVQKEGRA